MTRLRARLSQEQLDSGHAFVAHHRQFRSRSVGQYVEHRHDGVSRKEHVVQELAWLVQHFAERHRDELQVRVKSPTFLGRQCRKQTIPLWFVKGTHARFDS